MGSEGFKKTECKKCYGRETDSECCAGTGFTREKFFKMRVSMWNRQQKKRFGPKYLDTIFVPGRHLALAHVSDRHLTVLGIRHTLRAFTYVTNSGLLGCEFQPFDLDKLQNKRTIATMLEDRWNQYREKSVCIKKDPTYYYNGRKGKVVAIGKTVSSESETVFKVRLDSLNAESSGKRNEPEY